MLTLSVVMFLLKNAIVLNMFFGCWSYGHQMQILLLHMKEQ